ncbi:hypothetical protein SAMN05216421_3165 [Halopseudomonas xinjiangensis]|uniref:Uncharacterized protein n=1 Tax=Halopseudomonas xinjiangensis TaxID=487184 RepID=A0A1H1YIQ2_9GAMM|nr:hypothetical protein [Halopseudomonas xinjiangensis]SDT21159.1 hypothetical protein SAMN05216421_3165 [Halopseudomonas xinjiangensis]
MSEDRPRYRVSADRQSASRRVRYVETIQPEYGQCTVCELDELADLQAIRESQRSQEPSSSTPQNAEPTSEP